MCLLASFNVQNFKKPLEWIRGSEYALQFWVQNDPFMPTRYFFFKKTINSSPMYFFGLFYCAKLKKFLE